MSESEMLKPCPFCGGEATRTTMRKFKYVSCENSDCSMVVEAGALFSREEEAITAWNTRAPTKADLQQAIDAGILEAATNAAYERGKAEERARIVAELERMREDHLEESRKPSTHTRFDIEKSHRRLAVAYGYIIDYLRNESTPTDAINIVTQE